MHYMINQAEKVVAVTPELLELLKIDNSDTFYTKLALNEITLTLEDDTHLTIVQEENTANYPVTVSLMDGVDGLTLKLVSIQTSDEAKLENEAAITSEDASETESEEIADEDIEKLLQEAIEEEEKEVATESSAETEERSSDDEILSLLDDGEEASEEATETKKMNIAEEMLLLDEIDLFGDDNRENASDIAKEVVTESGDEADETFKLFSHDADEEKVDPEMLLQTEKEEESAPLPELPSVTEPIVIDVEAVSEVIGISPKDYHLFLNEYIDTALANESKLRSNNSAEKQEAIETLTRLTQVLHLPVLGDVLSHVAQGNSSATDLFYQVLGELTTKEEAPQESSEKIDDVTEALTPQEEHTDNKENQPSTPTGAIDLSDVEPIRFDFSIEEAASDLGLPTELIEEFVTDFIEQAHTETQRMIEAYEKGDLETVQKIGHLLKGTSSNLRITPLADTLYEIQFNDTLERVPELVRNYWGHFLALENQFKLTMKK